MKLCILIQAHKELEQLKRIIKRIEHPNIDIWVALDKKFAVNEAELTGCHIIKNRFDIKWGDVSQIDATINNLEEINNSKIKYNHILFISGQDYPTKPMDQIIEFFNKKENKDKEFIHYQEVSKNGWNVINRYRYNYYKNKYLRKISSLIMNKKFIKGYKPYGGATWFNITPAASEYIVKKYKEDNFHKYFKHSRCIDELIIQSILLQEDSKFKNKVVNDYKRYVDWSDHIKGLNDGSPNILTKNDFEAIINSDAFFARKFDLKIDTKILDMLDEYLDDVKKCQ